MITATENQIKRLVKLGYDGYGVVESKDNNTGRKWLELQLMNFPYVMPAPLLESVAEWLREKQGMYIVIMPCSGWCYGVGDCDMFEYEIRFKKQGARYVTDRKFHHGYDRTLSIAINHAIRTLENQNKKENGRPN